jgi:hypothetical protein
MSFLDTKCFNLAFNTWGNTSAPKLFMALEGACAENIKDSIGIIFYLRDYRNGLGFRHVGRRALMWLFLNHTEEFEKVMHLIPQYGRWDDLLEFFPNVLNLNDEKFLCRNYSMRNISPLCMEKLLSVQLKIVCLYANQLIDDRRRMHDGEKVTLCAKWAPTEKDSYDRKYETVGTITSVMNITKSKYRKFYISPLRSYLKITERNMCAGEWKSIDYNYVTKHAMIKYIKCFDKYDYERFRKWKDDLVVYKNTSMYVDPHHLLMTMRKKNFFREHTEKIWENVKNCCDGMRNSVACVNTGIGIAENNEFLNDVAMSIAILASNTTQTMFRNSFISHTYNPKTICVKDRYLHCQWRRTCDVPFDTDICIKKLYAHVLCTKSFSVSENVDRIIIITNTSPSFDENVFDELKKIHPGRKIPQLIWWNIMNDSVKVKMLRDNVIIYGFHYVFLREIVKNEKFNIDTILKNITKKYC